MYGLGFVVILGILTGGYFAFVASKSTSNSGTPKPTAADEVVNTLKPEDVGLEVKARSDGKAVTFTITKPDGITAVDYEVTYLAKDVPRGVIGHIDVTSSMSEISPNIPDTNGYIVLGTSSSGHYKYDEGVTSVKFVLKLTKSDNKVYQVEKTLDLSQ